MINVTFKFKSKERAEELILETRNNDDDYFLWSEFFEKYPDWDRMPLELVIEND